jgi:ribose/xylose/arabinose/galactoside ABC-type transport system permease subunit
LDLMLGRFSRAWAATVVLFVIAGVASPGTFSMSHVEAVLEVTSFLGVTVVGQTLVMMTAGIDLSNAGVITLANLVAAGVMNGRSAMLFPGIALVLVLGGCIGLVNGLFVTKLRVSPLITTLAMYTLLVGAGLLYTNGAPRGAIPSSLTVIGEGHIAGIPVSAMIWVGIVIVGVLLTKRTVFGRRLSAVGANPRAARLAGVSVDRVIMMAYVLSGIAAAIAGLLLSGFTALPSLGIGDPYQLTSVAAVVIGGTALTGGTGSALFVTELLSLTTTLNVSTGGQYLMEGVIIIASTAFNSGGRIRVAGRRGERATANANDRASGGLAAARDNVAQ